MSLDRRDKVHLAVFVTVTLLLTLAYPIIFVLVRIRT